MVATLQRQRSELITPTLEYNVEAPITELIKKHPELFQEPYRVSLYALKNMPRFRLYWSPSSQVLVLSQSGSRRDETGSNSEIDTVLTDAPVTGLTTDRKNELSIMDSECRKNQFVFHNNHFIMQEHPKRNSRDVQEHGLPAESQERGS